MTKLKTYVQCPRQFFFRYIERVEPSFRPIALAFGSAWHETIGEHLTHAGSDNPMSREELGDFFRDALENAVHGEEVPVLFEDQEDLGQTVDLGIRMLGVYLDRVPPPEKVIGVEVPFSIELAHPVTGEIVRVPLIGSIDAFVIENGKPTVLELKTAKRSGGRSSWSSTFSRPLTRWAPGGGFEEAELKLVVTTKTKKPDVQVERLVRHRGDERELAELAYGVLEAAAAGIDYRVRGWQCKNCAYADACAA